MRLTICRKIAIGLAVVAAPAGASQQAGPVALIATSNTSGSLDGFTLTGTRTAKPACAVEDVWTTSSLKIFSLVLSAHLTGKNVSVFGSGTCNATQPTREEVGYVTIP